MLLSMIVSHCLWISSSVPVLTCTTYHIAALSALPAWNIYAHTAPRNCSALRTLAITNNIRNPPYRSSSSCSCSLQGHPSAYPYAWMPLKAWCRKKGMLRHSGLLQLNFYGSCTPESFTHPITLMRFQRGKATIENIKSFLQSIQSCTCQKKINACLLAEIFILTSIWRLAISEDLAASAAE